MVSLNTAAQKAAFWAYTKGFNVAALDITGYDNEDIYRAFSLQTGTVSSYTPVDITSLDFEMDVIDAKTLSVIVRCTTNESDNRIAKTDPTNGKFEIKIAQGEIAYIKGRSLKYDLLQKDSLGVFTRLCGGSVKVAKGVTDPE